MSKGSRK